MKTRYAVLVLVGFVAGGVCVASIGGGVLAKNIGIVRHRDDSRRDATKSLESRTAGATADTAGAKENLETRLVKALKNTWSFRVEDGKLPMSENFPPGLQVEGCEFITYGYEAYSVGAVAAEDDKVYHARFYHAGGLRLDGRVGGSAEWAWDLKWLKKVLGVPEDKVQRALVVRFWAGDRESKVRYLINERLWDDSW